MQTFRILYLRNCVLHRTETLDALDLLEAIDRASERCGEETAEIWSANGKVGSVAPLPQRDGGSTLPERRTANRNEDSAIAREMRRRLDLAPSR